jgi:hypothetical protein
MTATYTSTLSAGQGMIEESRTLLDLWQPGMEGKELYRVALTSGRFPTVSAKRLQHMVIDAFTPRVLTNERPPSTWLKSVQDQLGQREFSQLMFLYTSRANLVLADFIREVYWPAYAAGRESITYDQAYTFVLRANQDGKTTKRWTEILVKRVAGYLTGTCADFGLLESGRKQERKILPFHIEPRVAAILAYDLHFAGLGDNRIIAHPDWQLFGMEREDVLAELKRLALRALFIIQAAGDVVKIHWPYKSMDEVIHVVTQSEF